MERLKNIVILLKTLHREKPAVFWTYIILRFFVLGAMVFSLVNHEYENFFICVLVLILFLLPGFLQDRFSIALPSALEVIILVFIFAAEILGELQAYYVTYTHWDTILHTTWGFLCAAFGFCLVDLLNASPKVKMQLSPLFVAVVAFCFSMTIGVIWEFFEFSMDILFHTDMQKDTVVNAIYSVYLDPTMTNTVVSLPDIGDVTVNGRSLGLGGYLDIGLYDTMEDLFVNFIGALTFSVIGYFYIRTGGRSRIAKNLIPTVTRPEPEDIDSPESM